MEAVILAGGLGTRLRSVVDELPKSMAPVNGKPFLYYILRNAGLHGVERIILATGYRSEAIFEYFGYSFGNTELVYSAEKEPLGTGGALLLAANHVKGKHFIAINGDTLFNVDLADMNGFFLSGKRDAVVALKPMKSFDRYGSVTVEGRKIASFNEKRLCTDGLINGGVYIIDRNWLTANAPSEKFSFEKDLLEKNAGRDEIYGFVSDTYFIDIGIPEDYSRACLELND